MVRGVRSAAVGVVLILVSACGGGGGASSTPTTPTPTATTPATTPSGTTPTTPSAFSGWGYTGEAWQAMGGAAPACPSPLTLPLPVNLDRVTSILYPGQVRGDYKAHGGFRYDGTGQTTAVTITATMASEILRASRYLLNGEIQYTFDLLNSCGIMTRYGHLRELAPRFQALADTLAPAIELDSRSTFVTRGQMVAAGETIATHVGIRDNGLNVFMDYGVYDLRQRNASSQDAAWLAAHLNDTMPYGTCWFDTLSGSDAARVRALPPADGVMGRTSDYCR